MSSAQTLSLDNRRLVAAWAADCAEGALPLFEIVSPDDPRVRAAIQQARDFALGTLPVADAIRSRGAEAGAAARAAPTQAARAAAYAAEQAAAVAHLGAHALGAAGYAVKARNWSHRGADFDLVVEARQLVDLAGAETACALRSLPPIGGTHSGILGPGRLSTGLVGEAILAIQKILDERARPSPGRPSSQ